MSAAVAADDVVALMRVIDEARQGDRLEGLAIALAVEHVRVCREYYDVDTQRVLDELAFGMMTPPK